MTDSITYAQLAERAYVRDAQSTDPAGQYKSPDNTITYQVQGSDLLITTPDGTVVVKDFSQNNRDLNLRLIDLPQDPTPTYQPPAFIQTGELTFYQANGTDFNDRRMRVEERDANLDGTPDYAGVDAGGDGLPDNWAFTGSSSPEILRGLDGEDDIDWGGGADRVYGDAGDDFIGDLTYLDFIIAPPYNDPVYEDGGTGRDLLEGGTGNDHLIGGSDESSDLLEGSAGDDYLEGGAGNDLLYGGAGDNVLLGNSESDVLQGEGGEDRLPLAA